METKKPKIVIAPEGCAEHLTAGKEYDIVDFWADATVQTGYGFNIIDDEGDIIYANEKSSQHLNGKDWIIKERG